MREIASPILERVRDRSTLRSTSPKAPHWKTGRKSGWPTQAHQSYVCLLRPTGAYLLFCDEVHDLILQASMRAAHLEIAG